MNRLKDIWSGQDDMNRVLLLIAVAVFAWSLIEGHGMYGALLAVVVEPERVVGVALHPLAVCGKYYPVASASAACTAHSISPCRTENSSPAPLSR